eukprot:Gb_31309 [translate_table: standard]
MQILLNPSRQFVAIVASAKYDTKIGLLNQIYKKVDKLVLDGLVYNSHLCAKYRVKIVGVEDLDIELAKELVEKLRQRKTLKKNKLEIVFELVTFIDKLEDATTSHTNERLHETLINVGEDVVVKYKHRGSRSNPGHVEINSPPLKKRTSGSDCSNVEEEESLVENIVANDLMDGPTSCKLDAQRSSKDQVGRLGK